MIYTLTLNPALDYDVYLNEFVQGEINSANKIKIRAGGKGVNVSKVLNNLREESLAMGFIAGFSGELIKQELHEKGIKTNFITVDGLTRLNVKISTENSKETEIAGVGPIFSAEKIELLLKSLQNLNSNDILVLSGSIPNSISNDIYKIIVESLPNCPKIVLDTRGELIKQNISESKGNNYILIKPNILELEELFNEKIVSDTEIINKAKYFLDYGIQNVLVSKGSDGALLVTQNSAYVAKVPKGKLVNSIGAGDSMVAGFISGYIKGDIESAFRLSVASGSATAYSMDMAEYDSIMDLYNNVDIKKIY